MSSKTNWKKLVGKRCLVTDHPYHSDPDVYEITILEVSPGGRLKVQFAGSGAIGWEEPEDGGELTLVEILEG